MLYLLLLGLGVYSAVLGFMYTNQRRMIYHPDTVISEPAHYGLSHFTDHFISGSHGRLQLWHAAPAVGMPLVVYFHGNAMHLGNRAGIYAALAAQGFGVLALSYRGYGKSEGAPDESGLYEDARAAMAFAQNDMGVEVGRIILFGESLGTGVAVQMATEYAVGGLVLQAAYLSVAQRAAEIYWYIPVHWLIKDRFHSLSKIASVKAPLLLFHGELDDTIPIGHGRQLFETATSAKQAHFFPQNGHNDFDSQVISEHVLAFARAHHLVA